MKFSFKDTPCKDTTAFANVQVHYWKPKGMMVATATCFWALLLVACRPSDAWTSASIATHRRSIATRRYEKPAGSFFNPVPENENDDNDSDKPNPTVPPPVDASNEPPADPFEADIIKLLRQRKAPSLASQPSTINGKPTAGQGFGVQTSKTSSSSSSSASASPKATPPKPYVGIGPRIVNDPTKPEYDDQGYTLYANEETGEKQRVFEALVDYPCDFTLKIVGANEGSFVQEMVAVVAESCSVSVEQVPHSVRAIGKWTSVTVHAPVQSAQMLYQLYENVDRDPRVRFKF